MNIGLLGVDNVNVWVDAVIRLNIVVGMMTVVVMGLIYIERKVIARFQMRLGPTRTGPLGLLQSVADALKLLTKEDLRPKGADPLVFELAVYAVFVPVFMGFVAIPFAFDWNVRVLELGLFYIIAISSVNVVGWVMAGWASDNRYAMLGALRAAAQGISYEVPLILSVLAVAMVAQSLNLNEITEQQGRVPYIVWQPLAFVIFYVAMLAELNRSPFDIPVGESEVVGGPFVEYSGIRWSMFFLAEYAGLFILALLGSAIFLGGWAWPLGEAAGAWLQLLLMAGKTGLLIFTVFWVRVTVPRMRIDQLMGFAWKVLLPISFALILANGLILVYGWADVFLLIPNVLGLVTLYVVIEYGITRKRPRQLARPEGQAEPVTGGVS
jgi:NADH-quinone oxidoreductase subunit H